MKANQHMEEELICDVGGRESNAPFLGFCWMLVYLALVGLLPVKIYQLFMPSVEVTVDGEVVYRGSSSALEVVSYGDATTIKINKLYSRIMTGVVYKSKDVVIKPLK